LTDTADSAMIGGLVYQGEMGMAEATARQLTFAVMGTGGVGGYYGGRLADAGAKVGFVARGAHLQAIQEQGLTVLSPLGDVLVHPALATADPARIGPVDVVLFAVKLYDTDAAAAALAPLMVAETVVISLQNDVEAESRLADRLGE